jgi:RNA-splicing ligase RtcB
MGKVHDKLLVWGSEVDYWTREQANRAARLDFVPGHVALMPDAHVAYKDIRQVMADQSDLTEVVHVLNQVLNYKGTG